MERRKVDRLQGKQSKIFGKQWMERRKIDRLQGKEGRLLSLARNLADRETGSHQQGRQQRTPIVVVVASTVFSLNFCTGLSGYSRKVINARKESGNHVAVQIKR